MTAIHFNPAFGAAGDMLLAALLDAGADERAVRSGLDRLGLGGWRLQVDEVMRCGIRARRAEVVVDDDSHHHRSWSAIDTMIADAGLGSTAAALARQTFRLLGDVEAGRHDVTRDEVRFHEVGAIDAIIDIVGVSLCLESLGVSEATSSGPIGMGQGTVIAAHGGIPVPAPATADLALGLPVVGVDTSAETVTPTGMALLRTAVTRWGPIPAGHLEAVGYGAGARDIDGYANVVQVLVVDDQPNGESSEPIVELVTNIDDASPELLAYVVEKVLGSGANDAWVTPIVVKKGRAAHQLHVLCAAELADDLTAVVAAETGTLGVRRFDAVRTVLHRSVSTVEVDGNPIRIKVGPYGAKPEFDDVSKAARSTGRPLREVTAEALQTYHRDE